MRETKFRAFYNGKWFYQTLEEIITITLAGFRLGKHKTQFTGLKDKNGKEIYEGDIIRRPLQTKMLYETTIVKWENFLEGFVTKGEEWEIIGNIYENPELLNK